MTSETKMDFGPVRLYDRATFLAAFYRSVLGTVGKLAGGQEAADKAYNRFIASVLGERLADSVFEKLGRGSLTDMLHGEITIIYQNGRITKFGKITLHVFKESTTITLDGIEVEVNVKRNESKSNEVRKKEE